MKIGTKSILFGYHQFLIHPLLVAWSWYRLYGFPWDYRLWLAFFLHDIGYWGKENMDGPEGERHPELGAKLMSRLFDRDSFDWQCFMAFHSRFYAKQAGRPPSRLCYADKRVIAVTPSWIQLLLMNLTGEIKEYMKGQNGRTSGEGMSQWKWCNEMRKVCAECVEKETQNSSLQLATKGGQ